MLPFENLSGDPKQEYLSDGITENIIMALSKTPKLFVFEKAIRLNPSPPSWYISAMGISYTGMGNYEKAIMLFPKAINTAPTAGNHALLCYTLSMIGKHEEALLIMEKATNFGRKESQYEQNMLLSHLAEYYRRTGRYQEAIDTGRKLLGSKPNDKHTMRAYITLACACSALGKDDDAHAAAEDILRISPDFSLAALTDWDSYMGLSFYDWLVKHEPDKILLLNVLQKAGLR